MTCDNNDVHNSNFKRFENIYRAPYLLCDMLIAPVRCPVTRQKFCLWLSVNRLHKSKQLGLLVRRQHPIGWTAVRRNRDEWQRTRKWWEGERGGQAYCWIAWWTTDKLTTSVFIHHTNPDPLKGSCRELNVCVITVNILLHGKIKNPFKKPNLLQKVIMH